MRDASGPWIQELLSRIEPDGFRIAAPVRASGGRWVVDHWIASDFIPGLRPAAPSWSTITSAGVRFSEAADDAAGPLGVLEWRDHRWAMADRAAWDELDVPLPFEAVEVANMIRNELVEDRQAATSPLISRAFGDRQIRKRRRCEGDPVEFISSLRPRLEAATVALGHQVAADAARRIRLALIGPSVPSC